MRDEIPFVLLNGKFVDPSTVSPLKHKFIGMFRPPIDPTIGANCYILCPCGSTLKYVHEGRDHYLKGCFDHPQYVDIEQ